MHHPKAAELSERFEKYVNFHLLSMSLINDLSQPLAYRNVFFENFLFKYPLSA